MDSKYPDPYKHIVLSQQFTPEYLQEFFALTDEIRDNPGKFSDALRGKIIAALFYEPSTRTRFSFEAAVHRLGGSIISTENAHIGSSAAKGESLEDTVKTLCGYADMIVLRHADAESSNRALSTTTVPFINAGSGGAQHPTQALLDVYTVRHVLGTLENLSIGVVGDLRHSRTCSSFVYLMSKFSGNRFTFAAPTDCEVRNDLKEHLKEHNVGYSETEDFDALLPDVDVLYTNRIQAERFADPTKAERARGKFVLTQERANKMKQDAIILNPLPRIDEIDVEVDSNPRAKYFEQARNGLWVRMALLKLLNDNS